MKIGCLPLGALLVVAATGCNLSRTLPSEEIALDPPPTSGARLVAAKGQVLRLGSDDPQASVEERPGWTRFTHDFWMDTTEFTQEEFQARLGRNPSKVKGDDLPVTDVTWYDAILAANARSKSDALDTVYEYSKAAPAPDGGALELAGLSIHCDRSGWRLPTEAEWEFAARAGSTSAYVWGTLPDTFQARRIAWYQANANGVVHPVGALEPNAWGLHDMAGNAMEWVQDWKGAFPEDTLPDYAGPESPFDVPEIPLKGGAASYPMDRLRPSSRTATYAAYRSARAGYVGFRLVRGAFRATYSDPSGEAVQSPPVTLRTDALTSALGTKNAKLVFLNRANGKGVLGWVDFAEATPSAHSIQDRDPIFHPEISPDGNWVVWTTAMEGSASTSARLKARWLSAKDTTTVDLGAGSIPRWWVEGTDTFLVWTTSARDNTDDAWNGDKTFAARWSSDGPRLESPRQWALGGFHDGRSGSLLYTGYRRLLQLDLRTQARKTLFTAPSNGKLPGDTSQVCNVSSAPDGSGRAMFLDFGFNGFSSVVRRPYGIHEIAFVSDSTGKILQQIEAPLGKSRWDHLEWSNHPRWASAVALEQTGAYKEIHLLDLSNGTSVPIALGEDLWMPKLWIGTDPVFQAIDPDSAGAWTYPINSAVSEEFAIKTRAFWLQHDSIQVAFIGSSRVKSGFNPSLISVGRAFNWGYSGAEALGNRIVVEHYLLPHTPRLQVVLLSLMPGWMFMSRAMAWADLESSVGYRYDRDHAFWRDGIPSDYVEAVKARMWPSSDFYDSQGGRIYRASTKVVDPPPVNIPANTSDDLASEPFTSNWTDLVATIDTLNARGIQVVLVNFPQRGNYRSTPYMGIYGPTWETWRELSRRIKALETTRPRFRFYDAHQEGMHDFPDKAFINEDHLNYVGAILLTRRLDSILRELPLRAIDR